MKLIHLSDLHIGKRLNDFSMIEDQQYILDIIIKTIDEQKPDGIILAGDIYDKSIPSAEAVQLFDNFLVQLSNRNINTYIISGNHDSPERISFASRIINKTGIYLSPVYNGKIEPITTQDEHGTVNIYLLPFIKPAHVRRYYPDTEISTYTDAVKTVIENMEINPTDRNILITHQFITGASRSESEDISVGGTDNVDSTIFEPFDYVALGHLHKSQHIGKETIRYCGTPLKYSFSEANDKKTITIVDIKDKNNISIDTVPLIPKRDLREIKGSYMEITSKKYYENINTDDYMHITLTDEDDILDALGKLRTIYPNIMKLDYDNTRTRAQNNIPGTNSIANKKPIELISEFYNMQNGQEMTKEQFDYITTIIEDISETE